MVGLSTLTVYLIGQLCLAWLLVPITLGIGLLFAWFINFIADQIKPQVGK